MVESSLATSTRQAAEIQGVGLGVIRHLALAQAFGVADHFTDRPETEAGHDAADLFCDRVEEVHHVFGLALEFAAQAIVEGGDADRAGVQMALAHVDAAHGDESGGTEVVFLGAQQGGVDDVLASAHTTVGPQGDAIAKAVEQQHLMRFGHAHFPGSAGRSSPN